MENAIILGFVDNTVSIINTPSCYYSMTIDNLQVSGHHSAILYIYISSLLPETGDGPDLADKFGLLAKIYTSVFSPAISLHMGGDSWC